MLGLPRARGGAMSELQLDRAGRRRSPATMPGFLAGRPPRNKGLRYPADPPKVEEIIAVMRAAGDGAHGRRLRGLIVILWRAGLRIQEALALTEARSRSATRLAARPPRQGRTAPRGRHGRLGLARAPAVARAPRRTSRRAAVLRHQRGDAAAEPGPPRRHERNSAAPRPRLACAGASRHTSFATPTPSRWRAKESR